MIEIKAIGNSRFRFKPQLFLRNFIATARTTAPPIARKAAILIGPKTREAFFINMKLLPQKRLIRINRMYGIKKKLRIVIEVPHSKLRGMRTLNTFRSVLPAEI